MEKWFIFKYEDNNGDDFEYKYEKEKDAVKEIEEIMETEYESLCEEYPESDVTWLNRLLDCGNETEIYVPDTDEYRRIKMLW